MLLILHQTILYLQKEKIISNFIFNCLSEINTTLGKTEADKKEVTEDGNN